MVMSMTQPLNNNQRTSIYQRRNQQVRNQRVKPTLQPHKPKYQTNDVVANMVSNPRDIAVELLVQKLPMNAPVPY